MHNVNCLFVFRQQNGQGHYDKSEVRFYLFNFCKLSNISHWYICCSLRTHLNHKQQQPQNEK